MAWKNWTPAPKNLYIERESERVHQNTQSIQSISSNRCICILYVQENNRVRSLHHIRSWSVFFFPKPRLFWVPPHVHYLFFILAILASKFVHTSVFLFFVYMYVSFNKIIIVYKIVIRKPNVTVRRV